MQTFLPYADFTKSARVLDQRRLGKQRVEVLQVLHALDRRRPPSSWRRHPVVVMWFGYPFALCHYGQAICTEWISRGYRDACLDQVNEMA